jgi:hypothetical protein
VEVLEEKVKKAITIKLEDMIMSQTRNGKKWLDFA